MPSFNRVILAGNTTRDPMLKNLPSGTAVCECGLAINRKFRVGEEDREEVCFVDFAIFGKAAEVFAQYMQKGKPCLIEGRLKLDQWEAKDGGGKRSKLTVIADNFQFLGGKDQGDGDDDAPPHAQRATPAAARKPTPSKRPADAMMRPAPSNNPIGDDSVFQEADIPF